MLLSLVNFLEQQEAIDNYNTVLMSLVNFLEQQEAIDNYNTLLMSLVNFLEQQEEIANYNIVSLEEEYVGITMVTCKITLV